MTESFLKPYQTSMVQILYQKLSRSHNPSMKQFTLLRCSVYLSIDEIWEPFAELNGDVSMENDIYLKYVKSTDLN